MKNVPSIAIITALLLSACGTQSTTSAVSDGAFSSSSAMSSSESTSSSAMNEITNDDGGWHPDPGLFREESKGVFVHDGAKVRLHVPANVEVNVQDRSREDSLLLGAYALKIADLDQPLGYDKENARLSEEALKKGEFGPDMDFLLHESRKVVSIDHGKTNGKEFMVLSQIEVCDVQFNRILVFYRNGYQIQLMFSVPASLFIKQLPSYFTTNPESCKMADTNELLPVWKENGRHQFYADVISGKTPSSVNDWYKAFDDIVNSIELF